jgi:hypothetical protein
MGTTTAVTGTRRRASAAGAGVVLSAGILLAACGSGGAAAPAAAPVPAPPTTTVDAATASYCATVARVQAEQASPQAGQGGVATASATARRQVGDLVAAAPPELAADWRTVQQLTEQGLASLAQTGGDPKKIDRDELAALQQKSQPAVAHIKAVTEERCHVAFRAPG